MECMEVVATIAAVAAAIAAAVTARFAYKQIKATNSQSLFAGRMSCWTRAKSLLSLFEENRTQIAVGEEPVLAVDLYATFLTNNAWLCDMASAYSDPLQRPHHEILRTRIEEIRHTSMEAEILFTEGAARSLSAFLKAYADLLDVLYKYAIVVKQMRRLTEEQHWDLAKCCESTNELTHRRELAGAVDATTEAFNDFQRFGDKAIISQIRVIAK